MTDSKEWCDGDWRCRSSSKPFAGAESGSPGRALEAGKRGSPGRPVQAGIRGKRLISLIFLKVKQFPLTNWPYSLDNILYLNHTLFLNTILTK